MENEDIVLNVYSKLDNIHSRVSESKENALKSIDDYLGFKSNVLKKISKKLSGKNIKEISDNISNYISDIFLFDFVYNEVQYDPLSTDNEKNGIKLYARVQKNNMDKMEIELVQKLNSYLSGSKQDKNIVDFSYFLGDLANKSEDVKDFFDKHEIAYSGTMDSENTKNINFTSSIVKNENKSDEHSIIDPGYRYAKNIDIMYQEAAHTVGNAIIAVDYLVGSSLLLRETINSESAKKRVIQKGEEISDFLNNTAKFNKEYDNLSIITAVDYVDKYKSLQEPLKLLSNMICKEYNNPEKKEFKSRLNLIAESNTSVNEFLEQFVYNNSTQ